MKREKYLKLCMALSIKICEKHGRKVTGEMLRKQRNNETGCRSILKEFGSYQAAWDWMKPVRDAYGMD